MIATFFVLYHFCLTFHGDFRLLKKCLNAMKEELK